MTTSRNKAAITSGAQAHFDSLLPAASFSRRSFIANAVGAGFALAAQPISAQTVIKTDSAGLLAGEIMIPAADRDLPGYRAMPAVGTKLPTVLVIHEIFGVLSTFAMSAVDWPSPAIWPSPSICISVTAKRQRCSM